MWIVFAFKFKKIFSTEETVEEVRKNINELEKALYQNFTKVMDLAEEKIKKLRSFSAEAERRIQEYKLIVSEEAEAAFTETIEKTVTRGRGKTSKKEKEHIGQAELPLLNQGGSAKRPAVSPYAASYEKNKGDSVFAISEKARKELSRPESSVKKVPIVQPEIYMTDKPIESKKSFRTKVKELKAKGLDDEEIAAMLKRSIQEVRFSLEIS